MTLKPCPFCGSKANLTNERYSHQVPMYIARCEMGCVESPELKTKTEVYRWWNRRVTGERRMTPPLLTLCQQVLEASERVAPGPWKTEGSFVSGPFGRYYHPMGQADAEFSALSRTALPRLAKDVLMLVEALRRARNGMLYLDPEEAKRIDAALKAVGVEP